MNKNWIAGKLEQRRLDDLIPYARNARKHPPSQIAKIAGMIREFGFTTPLLITGDNSVIAGHGRIEAARMAGLDTVPVIVIDHLSAPQKKALIIADNKSALDAEWDNELLALEFEELKEMAFDLDLTGFEQDEIDGLLENAFSEEVRDDDTEPQTDRAEELREKWGVELGQLWQLGDHLLLCGDSTRADHVALLLGNDRPHLMVTDPPYGVEYDADWRNHASRSDGTAIGGSAIGKVMNDDRADWREAWALFPGEVAYVWHAMKTQYSVSDSLIVSGFEIRSEIVWVKSHFVISQGHYHPKHESCFYVVRNGGTGHWYGDRSQTTIWEISKPAKSETGHSTQKPLECMAIPMQNNSLAGDLVYEPFSGSGTTIIAGENLNRKVRAIEISPAYVAVALQRWADHTGKTPTLINA